MPEATAFLILAERLCLLAMGTSCIQRHEDEKLSGCTAFSMLYAMQYEGIFSSNFLWVFDLANDQQQDSISGKDSSTDWLRCKCI
jgi:hypothetical protein